MNRLATLAAVYSTAAVVVLACSSTSGAPPFMAPSGDDASSMNTGGDAGGGGGEDATEEPAATMPCADASLVLPTGSAKGGACGDCLKKNCMQELSTCAQDCVCTRSLECVIVNNNNYTVPACAEALSAIGAGNKGLTAIQACLPGSCSICNESSD
jgi:hypothetical protein